MKIISSSFQGEVFLPDLEHRCSAHFFQFIYFGRLLVFFVSLHPIRNKKIRFKKKRFLKVKKAIIIGSGDIITDIMIGFISKQNLYLGLVGMIPMAGLWYYKLITYMA